VADFPADFRAKPIINGKGATAYPIAAYTYLLAYLDQADADKGKTFVSFACWALTDGQATEPDLGYAPLPAEVQQKAIDELHTFTTGGSPIWPYFALLLQRRRSRSSDRDRRPPSPFRASGA
jgi:hypothetical protein